MVIFCPFSNQTTQKINILKKWKKHLEMSSFFKCVPKITIIWCMLSEIWSTTDNFLSFWTIFCPFTPLLTPKNKTPAKCKKNIEILSSSTCVPWMKIIWCMVLEIKDTTELFCHFGPFFDPPNNPKNQNFYKKKSMPENIIILYLCAINDVRMMYGSWNMECERQNFLSFWNIFCPLTPLTTQKTKKCMEIL